MKKQSLNVEEYELDNLLESSLIVKPEVNRKINKLKRRIKIITEQRIASPQPTSRLESDNRAQNYQNLPRINIKNFGG